MEKQNEKFRWCNECKKKYDMETKFYPKCKKTTRVVSTETNYKTLLFLIIPIVLILILVFMGNGLDTSDGYSILFGGPLLILFWFIISPFVIAGILLVIAKSSEDAKNKEILKEIKRK